MLKQILPLTLTLLTTLSSFSISQVKPKLVVNIVVSQMRYDYLLRYSNNLSSKGFKFLIQEGNSCERAYYNFLNTNNPSGLATFATGSNPSTHGIIGDQWFNHSTSERERLLEDKRVYTVGTDEFDTQLSPRGMYASSIGDGLKSVSPYSKIISVAFDPISSIIMGGHNADASYWVNRRQGHFVSNTYYMEELPEWVNRFNRTGLAQLYSSTPWTTILATSSYYNMSNDVKINSKKHTFEKGVREDWWSYNRLRTTPHGNTLIRDFAVQAIIYEALGQDNNTDILNIVFDPSRYIGEKYGVLSMETEDAFYHIDKEIASLMEYLNTQFNKEDLLIVLSSDQGASNQYTEMSKVPGGKFNTSQFSILLNGFIGAQLGGDQKWVLDVINNQIYLDRGMIYRSGRTLEDVQNILANFAVQFRGVSQAITSSSLTHNNYSSGIMGKVQNSFFHRNSGDLVLSLLPGWIIDSEKLSDSGTGYNYDTHVPLIFWGAEINTDNVIGDVDMCDIAPTIAHIIGIAAPNAATGKPITEIYIKKK